MNITVMSDLHLEFHKDKGKSFLAPLEGDVLVLGGDIGLVVDGSLQFGLSVLTSQFNHVVAVFGNHEYYQSCKEDVTSVREDLNQQFSNLHVLEDSTVTIEGQRFIGSTLWFPDIETARPYWRNLNDFNVIRGFEDWVFDVNAKSVEYLKRNIKPKDIVVTHHIPTQMGSNKRWWNTPLQPFFVCNMEPTLLMQHPKVWIFGHTHDSHDSMFGTGKKKTHLVCNPFGYARQAENEDFQEDLVVSSFPGLGV